MRLLVEETQAEGQAHLILELACRTAGCGQELRILSLGGTRRFFDEVGSHRDGCPPKLGGRAQCFFPWKGTGNLVEGQRNPVSQLEGWEFGRVSHGRHSAGSRLRVSSLGSALRPQSAVGAARQAGLGVRGCRPPRRGQGKKFRHSPKVQSVRRVSAVGVRCGCQIADFRFEKQL